VTKMEQIEFLKQKVCRLDGVASVDMIDCYSENLNLNHRKMIVTGYQSISLPKIIATILNNYGDRLKVIWYVKYLDSRCQCGRPENMHTGDKWIHWN